MLNPSDKRLEAAIVQALKPETPSSAALKQEIWEGLMAKVEALSAPADEAEAAVDAMPVIEALPCCDDPEPVPLTQRVLKAMAASFTRTADFLFADEIALSRAPRNTMPVSYLLTRGSFSFSFG